MPQRHGDTEIRSEERTRRQEEGETRCFQPCLLVSLSPLLLVFLSLSLWLYGSVAAQTESFERRAISSAQEMPASELDEALPDRPFAIWLSEVIGPKAGVVW